MKNALPLLLLCLGACSSSEPEEPVEPPLPRAEAILLELNAYGQSVSTATKQNVSFLGNPERTDDVPTLSYAMKFQTSDPGLMAKDDADTNNLSLARNTALTEGWSRRFCTQKLKAIMTERDIFLVSGQLLNQHQELQTFSACMR